MTYSIVELGTLAFTLTEAFKLAGFPSKLAPILSIVIAVIFSIANGYPWFTGIVSGLMASGLYSGVKAVSKEEPQAV